MWETSWCLSPVKKILFQQKVLIMQAYVNHYLIKTYQHNILPYFIC